MLGVGRPTERPPVTPVPHSASGLPRMEATATAGHAEATTSHGANLDTDDMLAASGAMRKDAETSNGLNGGVICAPAGWSGCEHTPADTIGPDVIGLKGQDRAPFRGPEL